MRFDIIDRSFLVSLIILVTVVFLSYCTYRDYKYREFKRRRDFLLFYPFVFYANYVIVGNFLITLISFSFLFLILYITNLMYKKEGFGCIDLLVAPLFTVWFNQYSVYYSLIVITLYYLCFIPFINKKLVNRGRDTISIPMIPLMMISFLISIVLFPSSITYFFNTF